MRSGGRERGRASAEKRSRRAQEWNTLFRSPALPRFWSHAAAFSFCDNSRLLHDFRPPGDLHFEIAPERVGRAPLCFQPHAIKAREHVRQGQYPVDLIVQPADDLRRRRSWREKTYPRAVLEAG